MPSANPIQKQFEQDIRAAVPGLPDLAQHGLNRGRIKYDSDQIEGVYIGSSVAYKTYIGVRGRVEYHIKQSQKEWGQIPTVKRSRHYEAIYRSDVTPEFRVLALYEVHPGNTIATTIAEQVMMIYLGTMSSTNPIQKQFEIDIRAAVPGLPNLSHKGLNRGLLLAQGQHWMPRSQGLHKEWLTATGQTSQCFNCGKPGNEACDEKGWVGWFENRRCQPCYNWRWAYGHEKPQGLITDKQLHDIWVSNGNADACGNPACQEPRTPKGTFNFWGPDMRCAACARYKSAHGQDPENPRLGLTAAKHPSWVAEGNEDVYGTCHAPRPADSHLLGWQGWMTLSKCGACLYKPSAQEDAAWAEMYGDICAICGVGRRFTRRLRNRCDFRRCDACVVFREKNHRAKTGDEVDSETPALQKEWLAEGNADVCQLCGKERGGEGRRGEGRRWEVLRSAGKHQVQDSGTPALQKKWLAEGNDDYGTCYTPRTTKIN
ncbi:hypothetical protein ACHAQK_006216 [Fusarium lateritium]